MSRDLYNAIRKAKSIAKDFKYGDKTIKAIANAKNGKRNYTDFKNSKIDTGGIKGNGAV